MGKIFMDFSMSQFPNGPDIKIVNQIASCLPGETFIDSCTTLSSNYVWRVDFVNDNFDDGTEIVGNWLIQPLSLSNQPYKSVVIFKGISINPPIVSPAQTNSPIAVAGSVSTTTLPTASMSPAKYTINFNGIPIRLDLDDLSTQSSACQCGKDKHGFAKHSDWCDIKD